MYKRDSHCNYCGSLYEEGLGWPRTCSNCSNITYRNPLPVSVVLLPVDDGLLTIRRSIEPRKGMLALPGGFIGLGESWQQAGARELLEETSVSISAQEIRLFDVLSAPDGTVLIFGLADAKSSADLPKFNANEEVSELEVIREPVKLAFPLHEEVVRRYFEKVRG